MTTTGLYRTTWDHTSLMTANPTGKWASNFAADLRHRSFNGDAINTDHLEVAGVPGQQIIYVLAKGVLYSYGIPKSRLDDLKEISRQIGGARDIARITQQLNN